MSIKWAEILSRSIKQHFELSKAIHISNQQLRQPNLQSFTMAKFIVAIAFVAAIIAAVSAGTEEKKDLATASSFGLGYGGLYGAGLYGGGLYGHGLGLGYGLGYGKALGLGYGLGFKGLGYGLGYGFGGFYG